MMKFIRKFMSLKVVPTEEPEATQFYEELEVDVLARTLWGEARSEGKEGMEAVASVILNRVKLSQRMGGYWWGNDIIQVCQKPYQFSCWNKSDPQYQRVISVSTEDVYFVKCIQVARRALLSLIDDPTKGATHYHADYITASWSDIRKKTETIGHHIFYRLVEV